MTTIEVLKAARKLIDAPWNWTQNEFARDESGEVRMYIDPTADSYCMTGAIRSVTSTVLGARAPAEAALGHALGDHLLVTWNDDPERTHTEVIAVLDKAIAAEEAK